MSHPTTSSLLDDLRRFHVLEPAQFDELARSPASFPTEPKALAQELMRRGWLTPYQVNRLLQGRGKELLLGSYILLERLGEGGMGAVFKARNWKLGALRALKVIRKERMTQATAVQRFQREMRAAAQLSHPNVVHAHDADEVDGTHLIAMELLSGVDLGRRVTEGGPLPVEQACEYVRQAALGLQHAHERGLVHRDVKPSNLLVTNEGVVKVLDLGLARLAPSGDGSESSGTLTQPDSLMGTPDYMAPEQARQSHTVDGRADLYSLGATMYYLLTGRPPFAGGPLAAVIAALLFNDPQPVESLRPDTPPAVAAVVRRLMAKKPEDRYQTGAEVAATLEGILKGEGAGDSMDLHDAFNAFVDENTRKADGPPAAVQAPSPTPAAGVGDTISFPGANPPQSRPAAPPRHRRRRLLLYVIGALVLAAAVGAVWFALVKMIPAKVEPPAAPGKLIVTSADSDVRILLHGKGRTDARDGKVNELLDLPAGDYELELAPTAAPGLRLSKRTLTIRPGASETVRVEGFPFDADALVSRPGAIDGVPSWTIETSNDRIPLSPLALSPDGRWLAGAAPGGTIRLLDGRTGEARRTLSGHAGRVVALAWSSDGDAPILASVGTEGRVHLWNPTTGMLAPAQAQSATVLAWSPSGKSLALVVDRDIYVWNVADEQPLLLPRVHIQPARALAWSPDGLTLASAGVNFVHLWRAPDATHREWIYAGPRTGHTGLVNALAWSPDRLTFASAGEDGTVRLWDANDPKKPEKVLAGPQGAVNAVAWLRPDGRTVVALGDDGGLRFWDAAGDLKRTVPHVAKQGIFSPNGDLILAGGALWTARLWETVTGRPLGTAVLLPKGAAVISEDGHYHCYADRFWSAKDVEDQLTYVVRTDKGQAKYPPAQFATTFLWKNDPEKAKLDSR